MVVVGGCANADELTRDQAIASLESTGVATAEATCMADSLLALRHLGAARPSADRTEAERDALVLATNRCVRPEAVDLEGRTSSVESAVGAGPVNPRSSLDPVEPSVFGVVEDRAAENELRDEAIAGLGRSGRSSEFAACVVDRLLLLGEVDLLADPQFGMGLDSIEADALATCGVGQDWD